MKQRHTPRSAGRTSNTNTASEGSPGKPLEGKKVAILVADGFEQVELTEPRKALEQAGARTALVSPNKDKVKGWQHTEWGDSFDVDEPLEDARAAEFDALLLPGGVMNPDKLRMNLDAVHFVEDFFAAGKPVAAICHGPWTLVECGVLKGRHVTSYPSIKSDLINAGALWLDREVLADHGLVTSRKPSDIPAFNATMIEEFAKGIQEEQKIGAEPPGAEMPMKEAPEF